MAKGWALYFVSTHLLKSLLSKQTSSRLDQTILSFQEIMKTLLNRLETNKSLVIIKRRLYSMKVLSISIFICNPTETQHHSIISIGSLRYHGIVFGLIKFF